MIKPLIPYQAGRNSFIFLPYEDEYVKLEIVPDKMLFRGWYNFDELRMAVRMYKERGQAIDIIPWEEISETSKISLVKGVFDLPWSKN